MAKWYETAFGRLYPVLYGHRDDDEARRAAATFGSLFAGRGVVLDLGCGNGRYVRAFARVGVAMVGLDLSSFLLAEAAADAALAGRVVQGDMRDLPFARASLSGVINMFTSFGYFDTDDENRRVLSECARVIAPGGVFLIDFLNADRVVSAPLQRTRRERDGHTIDEDRSLSDDGRHLVKHVVVADADGRVEAEYDERVRLLTPGELGALLDGVGFRTTRAFGDYDGADFDASRSPRVIMACTRRMDEAPGGR